MLGQTHGQPTLTAGLRTQPKPVPGDTWAKCMTWEHKQTHTLFLGWDTNPGDPHTLSWWRAVTAACVRNQIRDP